MKLTMKCLSLIACISATVAVATLISGCAGDQYHRSTGQTIDDSSITARVKSNLLADPIVSGLDVDVDTYRGQVQLNGFVDTAQQKVRAEQIARQAEGVQWVKNNLSVKGTQEPAGAPAKKY